MLSSIFQSCKIFTHLYYFRVKQDLKDELIRVNHLVRDGLALTAMRDLERRAKQTVHILSNYRNVQSIADRANLYMVS